MGYSKLLLSFLLTLIVIVVACGESSNDPSEKGSLLIKVTDDPFPVNFVESATVIVDKIELRKNDDSEGNPFVLVAEGTFDFNLLELQNGITSELPIINIEPGYYDLVRLYVQSAEIVLIEDLGKFTLNVPSGDKTGIKLFIDPELQIQGGLTSELLLDFDLSNSFKVQGNMDTPSGIKGFNFTPVIRAVNNQLAGSIFGTVSDEDGVLEGAKVTATMDGISATAISDENGYYEIIGLKEGIYSANAFLNNYELQEKSDIEIVRDTKTEINFVLAKSN